MADEVVQLDDHNLRIRDRHFWSENPIDHFWVVGRRVLVVARRPPFWSYRALPLDVAKERGYFFSAEVFEGTNIGVTDRSDRILVLPSGREAVAPGTILTVAETKPGFVTLVRATEELRPRHVFLLDREGQVRWRIGENPWYPDVRIGYIGPSLEGDGRVFVAIDRIPGRFFIDAETGELTEYERNWPQQSR